MKEYPFEVVSLVTKFCCFLQDLQDEKQPKRVPDQGLTLLCQFKKLISTMSYSHGSNS